MKICYLNSGYLPDRGGVATFAGSLGYAMSQQADVDQVKVIGFNNSKPRAEHLRNLEIITFGRVGLLKMSWLVFKHVLKARNFEVFHATNLFPVGTLVLLFAKYFFGKKVFVTIYGTEIMSTLQSGRVRFLRKWTMRLCDKVLALSNSTANLARSAYGLNPGQVKVVYPGVDDKLFDGPRIDVRAHYGFQSQDFVVLTVGQLIKRKGVDDIIKAIGKISDPSVKLLIVGKGKEETNLSALVSDLHLGGRVIFAGSVSNISNYYRSANVFVMASKYLREQGDIEGLGIVLLEAQYFGIPVIGTDSGGIPEAFLDGQTGLLVPEGNPEMLAQKILELRNNHERAAQMSEKAKSFVRENFNWEKSVAEHLDLYRGS
ncbi:MAG: glycosyltransferase family 4 protein [bacterium]|nr:glycosyltransferase family 4 protein [bacterium]